ncbi:histidine ammonia-lyase [Bartonella sp. JB63]|nr:histidine ammonia-lyase [Bartonella sp. JB15]AQX29375.1 histidine ammonia-lyase [Bartonella sp. JB63]
MNHLRAHIKILEKDRYIAPDLEKARAFVGEGYLLSILPEAINLKLRSASYEERG